jgi:hypothetical protein
MKSAIQYNQWSLKFPVINAGPKTLRIMFVSGKKNYLAGLNAPPETVPPIKQRKLIF